MIVIIKEAQANMLFLFNPIFQIVLCKYRLFKKIQKFIEATGQVFDNASTYHSI